MTKLEEMIQRAGIIAVLGHVNPDGDCIGSCLAVYNYIKDQYPQKQTAVYLEAADQKFSYLRGFEEIRGQWEGEAADLCVCVDCSDRERLGPFVSCLYQAAESVCVDHHVTNEGYAGENIIEPAASSTCEVLFYQFEEERISKAAAECLYTGIIHDTGVFKYSNTTPRTMEAAGRLMAKGIPFSDIIDDSFYRKTYLQSQILGRALLESISFLDKRCIFSVVRRKDMDFYGVDKNDLGGIVEQLRIIEGVECAIFLYETAPHTYKVSMRSNRIVDVSRIAAYFGGGGHIRAAGCTMSGSIHDVINNLSLHIEKQLRESEHV